MMFYVQVQLEAIGDDWSITEVKEALLSSSASLVNRNWAFDVVPLRVSEEMFDV